MKNNTNTSTTLARPAETAQVPARPITADMFSLDQFTVPVEQFAGGDGLLQGPLPVRSPGKLEFVRVKDDPAYRARVCILSDQRNETTYLVAPALKSAVEGDVSTAELVLACNQDGEIFLWLAKAPAFDGEHFGTTRMAAISLGKTNWVRMRVRSDRKGYDIIRAAGSFPDPQWPDKTLDELCRESFADRFISTFNHPVLRRLRGEAA